jgi:hypothetical protein
MVDTRRGVVAESKGSRTGRLAMASAIFTPTQSSLLVNIYLCITS